LYARVATFESDPAKVDDAINLVRAEVESGDTSPGLEGAKMLMLVNRESGNGLGVTLFDSEDAMRRGDQALDATSLGMSERRTSVEFYEVPVQTVMSRTRRYHYRGDGRRVRRSSPDAGCWRLTRRRPP